MKKSKQSSVIDPLAVSISSDWVKAFAGQLREKGKSERTIQAYCQDVRSFSQWFEQENGGQQLSPELITGVDLRAYRQWSLEVQKVAPATWNRRHATLGELCKWAQQQGYLNYNPFQDVRPVAEVELAPRWLDGSEFRKVMRVAEQAVNGARTDAWRVQAIRDQAMVALMVYAALRVSEVVDLDLEDIELGERSGRVVIRMAKGEKFREVPLNAECRRALGLWFEVRNPAATALFTGKATERLSTRTVQRRVDEISRLAGVELTPHSLRHTRIKRLVDAGKLAEAKSIAGHVRIDTTLRYAKPGWKDLERAVEMV